MHEGKHLIERVPRSLRSLPNHAGMTRGRFWEHTGSGCMPYRMHVRACTQAQLAAACCSTGLDMRANTRLKESCHHYPSAGMKRPSSRQENAPAVLNTAEWKTGPRSRPMLTPTPVSVATTRVAGAFATRLRTLRNRRSLLRHSTEELGRGAARGSGALAMLTDPAPPC